MYFFSRDHFLPFCEGHEWVANYTNCVFQEIAVLDWWPPLVHRISCRGARLWALMELRDQNPSCTLPRWAWGTSPWLTVGWDPWTSWMGCARRKWKRGKRGKQQNPPRQGRSYAVKEWIWFLWGQRSVRGAKLEDLVMCSEDCRQPWRYAEFFNQYYEFPVCFITIAYWKITCTPYCFVGEGAPCHDNCTTLWPVQGCMGHLCANWCGFLKACRVERRTLVSGLYSDEQLILFCR